MPIELADFQELFGMARGGAAAPPLPVDLLLDREIDPDPRAPGRARGVDPGELEVAIQRASTWLVQKQGERGDWCFELESNIQIEAQCIYARIA